MTSQQFPVPSQQIQPVQPEPVVIPELFPGFRDQVNTQVNVLEQASGSLEGLAKQQEELKDLQLNLEGVKADSLLHQGGNVVTGLVLDRQQDELTSKLEVNLSLMQQELDRVAVAQWRVEMLVSLPDLIGLGGRGVIGVNELLNLAPNSGLGEEDRVWLERLVQDLENMEGVQGVTGQAQEASRDRRVIENLMRPAGNLAELAALDRRNMTPEQMSRAIERLSVFRHIEGVTPEEVRKILRDYLPDEITEEYLSFNTQFEELARRARDQDAKLAQLRQDASVYGSPRITSDIKQALWREAAARPWIVANKPFEYWADKIGKPFVGTILLGTALFSNVIPESRRADSMVEFELQGAGSFSASRLGPGDDFFRHFAFQRHLREDKGGNRFANRWFAAGEAFDLWETNGVLKFGLEVTFDPLNVIGLGMTTTVLKRLPLVGGRLAALNEGYIRVSEVPFKYAARGISKLPRSLAQRSTLHAVSSFTSTRRYLEHLKPMHRYDVQEARVALMLAIDEAILNPQGQDDMVSAGLSLLPNRVVELNHVQDLVGNYLPGVSVDALMRSITSETLGNINMVLEHTAGYGHTKFFRPEQANVLVLERLGLAVTDTNLSGVSTWLRVFQRDIRRAAYNGLEGDSIAQIMKRIMARSYEDFLNAQKSVIRNERYQAGILTRLLEPIDKVNRLIFINTIDRYLVMPFARSFLLFSSFGVFNVAEAAMKMGLAGVNPIYKSNPWLRTRVVFSGIRTEVPFDVITPAEFNISANFPEAELRQLGSGEILTRQQERAARLASSNFMESVMTLRWLGHILPGGRTFEDITGYNWARKLNGTQRQSYFLQMYQKLLWENSDTAIMMQDIETLVDNITPDAEQVLGSKWGKAFRYSLTDALQTGNIDTVRDLAESFNAGRVLGSEVLDIVSKYPDLPPDIGDLLVRRAVEGGLWSRGSDGINELFNGALKQELIELQLGSPGIFSERVAEIVDVLNDWLPNTVEELHQKMSVVDSVSDMYVDILDNSIQAAQFQLSRITNPHMKDRMWSEWWNVRMLPNLAQANQEMTRLTTKMRGELVTGELRASLGNNRLQVYLDLVEQYINEFTASTSWRQQQDALRREFFEPGGSRFIPAGMARGVNYGEFWNRFRAESDLLWARFQEERQRLLQARGGILSRDQTLRTMHMPEYISASDRALLPNDVARLFRVTPDEVARGLYLPDVMALRGRRAFANRVMAKAEEVAGYYDSTAEEMGYTPAKIGAVYDRIIAPIKVEAGGWDSLQPALGALEAIRGELIRLGLRRKAVAPNAARRYIQEVVSHRELRHELIPVDSNRISGDLWATEEVMDSTIGISESLRLTDEFIAGIEGIGVNVPVNFAGVERYGVDDFGDELLRIIEETVVDFDNRLTILDYMEARGVELPEEFDGQNFHLAITSGLIREHLRLSDLTRLWAGIGGGMTFGVDGNRIVQLIGATGESNNEYLTRLHQILRQRFPDGFINVAHITGGPGELFIDRNYVSVNTVLDAGEEGEVVPRAIIRVEDVVGIAGAGDSEIIIRSDTLRERLNNPLEPRTNMRANIEEVLVEGGVGDYTLETLELIGGPVTGRHPISGNIVSKEELSRVVAYDNNVITREQAVQETINSIRNEIPLLLDPAGVDIAHIIQRARQELDLVLPNDVNEAVRLLNNLAADSQSTLLRAQRESVEAQETLTQAVNAAIQRGTELVSEPQRVGRQVTVVPNRTQFASRLDTALSGSGTLDSNVVNRIETLTGDSWQDSRDAAMDETRRRFAQDFPNYSDPNAVTNLMKTIYPFWQYEAHRWAWWLPREALRHPGLQAAQFKYNDHTEEGYIPVGNMGADVNFLRGTIFMGGFRKLQQRDYPEFYDQFEDLSAANDLASRYGFYPGPQVTIPMAIGGSRYQQLGEVTPPWTNALVNMLDTAWPQSALARTVRETILPNRWKFYLIGQQVSKAGGDGPGLALKVMTNQELLPKEQQLWDSATRRTAIFGLVSEQFTLFRMNPVEKRQFHEQTARLLSEATGIKVETIEDARRRGVRIEDVYGPFPPEIDEALQAIIQLHYWSGFGDILGPSELVEQARLTREFWASVEAYSQFEVARLTEAEKQLKQGVIGMTDWNTLRREVRDNIRTHIDILRNPLLPEGERYSGVLVTLDERVAFARKENLPVPVFNALEEMQNMWYQNELKTKYNFDTGLIEPDWDSWFNNQEAMLKGVGVALEPRFRAFLETELTPLEQERRDINQDVLKGYNELYDIVLAEFDEDEQRVIREYSSGATVFERRRVLEAEITSLQGAAGQSVIGTYSNLLTTARTNMRSADPELDAWLVFWNPSMTPRSRAAERRWKEIIQEHGFSLPSPRPGN